MYKVLLLSLLFILPTFASAAENAGFIDGIWFSKQNAIAGDEVQIFVAVQNQTAKKTRGTVTFFDSGKEIDKVAFSLEPNSIRAVPTKYILKEGEHSISAQITPTYGSKLVYTTLPVRIVYTPPKPQEQSGVDRVANTAADLAESLSDAAKKIDTSILADSAADVAQNTASSTNVAARSIFKRIDPKAQELAKEFTDKSAELKQETEETPKNKIEELLGVKRTRQLAAAGFATLAFVFHHWLWHLIVAISLVILKAMFRKRRY